MRTRFQALCLSAVALVSLTVAGSVRGDVILAKYNLGEDGSIDASGNLVDSVGGHTLGKYLAASVVDVTGGAPGSTKALDFGASGTNGYIATASSFIPTDNFRVDIWAKTTAANINQDDLFFYSGDGTNMYGLGSLTIGMHAGNWLAMYSGHEFIGGLGQAAVADTWTKLSVQRINGVSTFYVNDAAVSGTSTFTPINNATIYLGLQPGGSQWFVGGLDQLTISQVPEPSVCVLLATGVLGLLAYAWRRRG